MHGGDLAFLIGDPSVTSRHAALPVGKNGSDGAFFENFHCMTTFHYILIAGVMLGVVQLAAGVAVGLWIAHRRGSHPETALAPLDQDAERAAQLAADLGGLTTQVATSVRRHNAAIESIDRRLRAETTEGSSAAPLPLTNLVAGVVGEMLSANQKLQKELNSAEAELERQSNELVEHRRQSLTDPLTNLPNRRALDDHLRSRMDAWRKHGEPFSLLMMDIDHFKRFNDTHGHQAGDAVLVAFATALSSALRKGDVVARYGGEEFAVLLPHSTLVEATAAVGKIRQAIGALSLSFGEKQLSVTASGGLASIVLHEAAESLIGRADEALYVAKENGRDCVFWHDGASIGPMGVPATGGDMADDLLLVPAAEADPLDDELREACNDLRAGFQAFMGDPSVDQPR